MTQSDGALEHAAELTHGNRREVLEALRVNLAIALMGAGPKEVPALSRELRAVVAELDTMPAAREDSAVVDLTARIAAKRAATGS